MKTRLLLAAAAMVLVLMTACGESDEGSPTAPESPAPQGATVTITSAGVEPKTVTIAAGQSVLFVNSDTVLHDMASDPHPVHDDCPPINRVGSLAPGQSRATDALSVARSCGFHDLLRDGDARWRGTVVVQ
jgi:plastocyanin